MGMYLALEGRRIHRITSQNSLKNSIEEEGRRRLR